MTSAELRRIADQNIVEANSLLRDADRLRSQAAALRGILDPLASISQRVWVGPAATNFEEECTLRARQVDDQAIRLQQIAAEFEDRARELRRKAATLRAQAVAADAVTTAAAEAAVLPAGVI